MKKNIAIVAGGYSGEYDISIKSAGVVKKNIDKKIFNPFIISITQKKWVMLDEENNEYKINKNNFTVKYNDHKIKFDCVFIAIHGIPGEDGRLQGYFDMLKIPYTTCGHTTSALTMNKNFCERIVNSYGVQTAPSVYVNKTNKIDKIKIFDTIKLPFFVKPNNGGSSVGMSKVNTKEELDKAIKLAFKENDEILISEFVKGREITNGVFRYKDEMIVFPITEVISKKEFFDYEAKYTSGLSEEITPAQIPEDIEKQCKAMSCYIYNKLNCKGVVRIDYIFNKDELYFLEVNTVPGLSEASIIPKQAAEYGITIKKLFTMMIEDALYRASN